MKLNYIISAFSALTLAACVTETKPLTPEDAKPYVATVTSNPATTEKPSSNTTAAALKSKKDSIPGHLVVKCRIDKMGKAFQCGLTTVKLTNEMSKSTTETTFKGERTAIPVASDGSYTIEVSTKGCDGERKFAGMTSGMGLTAQFENCGTK
ncbi:MAG: hypothetical protein JSU04_09635 [Bdellovibrionales bacterium]|nr:hypothetical protein [Bdellovibrionales bacterium]